jgi:hypothetical protein
MKDQSHMERTSEIDIHQVIVVLWKGALNITIENQTYNSKNKEIFKKYKKSEILPAQLIRISRPPIFSITDNAIS